MLCCPLAGVLERSCFDAIFVGGSSECHESNDLSGLLNDDSVPNTTGLDIMLEMHATRAFCQTACPCVRSSSMWKVKWIVLASVLIVAPLASFALITAAHGTAEFTNQVVPDDS